MSSLDSFVSREPILYGAVAWIAGFAVSLSVLLVAGVPGAGLTGGGLLRTAVAFFLATHVWPAILGAGIPGTQTAILFTPITGMIVFTAGFKLVPALGADSRSEGFYVGASLVAGYALLTVLSLFLLVGLNIRGQNELLLLAIVFLFSGVFVPGLFAGLGGYFAVRLMG